VLLLRFNDLFDPEIREGIQAVLLELHEGLAVFFE
jgi:hypothetical protein